MATEVLHSRDLLAERFRVPPTAFHRLRNFKASSKPPANLQPVNLPPVNLPPVNLPPVNLQPVNLPPVNLPLYRRQQRKVSPKHDNRSRFNAAVAASEAEAKKSSHGGDGGGLVMGQVTLLRRGEPLSSISPKEPVQTPAVHGNVSSPEIVLDQIRLVAGPPADRYAGSGMYTSPSPRCVPLPSFFSKKEENNCDLLEDDATRDLRRILRLE